MSTAKVKGLLAQLRDAANAIKAQIHEADDQIAALTAQRRALTDAPVSKADLMEYALADIQRRAANYQFKVERWARDTWPISFANLERRHVEGKQQPFPYLDGDPIHDGGNISHMESAGIFWNFGELFAVRFAMALNKLEFPTEAVPAVDRRRQIAEIDAKLKELNAKRDGLANDLISSGVHE